MIKGKVLTSYNNYLTGSGKRLKGRYNIGNYLITKSSHLEENTQQKCKSTTFLLHLFSVKSANALSHFFTHNVELALSLNFHRLVV